MPERPVFEFDDVMNVEAQERRLGGQLKITFSGHVNCHRVLSPDLDPLRIPHGTETRYGLLD